MAREQGLHSCRLVGLLLIITVSLHGSVAQQFSCATEAPFGFTLRYGFDSSTQNTNIPGLFDASLMGNASLSTAGGSGNFFASGGSDNAGVVGNCAVLPSASSGVGVMPLGSLGLTLQATWTLSAWVRNITSVPRALFRSMGSFADVVITTNFAGELGTYSGASARFFTTGFSLNNIIADDRWHMLTAVGANGQTVFYVDGARVGTPATFQSTGRIDSISNSPNATIRFSRFLDEVYMYPRNLSAAEVQALYETVSNCVSLTTLASTTASPCSDNRILFGVTREVRDTSSSSNSGGGNTSSSSSSSSGGAIVQAGTILVRIQRVNGVWTQVPLASSLAGVITPSSQGPNGLAFDATTGRLYVSSPTDLYFVDVVQPQSGGVPVLAGTLQGRATNGDFYNGSYYYVSQQPANNPTTSGLRRVSFNAATGMVDSDTAVADIFVNGSNPSRLGFGDIAILPISGLLYLSWSNATSKEFGSFNFLDASPVYTLIRTIDSSAADFRNLGQLAFSQNVLFSHNSLTGALFRVNPATGSLSSIQFASSSSSSSSSSSLLLLADLAGAPDPCVFASTPVTATPELLLSTTAEQTTLAITSATVTP